MGPGTSPNDPVFFLHHCNVDRLWARWQYAHPNAPYLPAGDGPAGGGGGFVPVGGGRGSAPRLGAHRGPAHDGGADGLLAYRAPSLRSVGASRRRCDTGSLAALAHRPSSASTSRPL